MNIIIFTVLILIGLYFLLKIFTKIASKKIFQHLNLNPKGRLIYVGAGTSGRIGVQDGVELIPTFNWPKSRLDYIIAGGNRAVLNSIENPSFSRFPNSLKHRRERIKSKF